MKIYSLIILPPFPKRSQTISFLAAARVTRIEITFSTRADNLLTGYTVELGGVTRGGVRWPGVVELKSEGGH